MANKSILAMISEHYGYEERAHQLVEEMGELTQALNKFWRARKRHYGATVNPVNITLEEAREHIAEEIADVSICLEQVTLLLDAEYMVEQYRESKISRQLKRMSEEAAAIRERGGREAEDGKEET